MAGNKVIMLLMAMIILKVEGSRQSDVEEIIAQASRLQQAYGARDMETLTSLYTDDCRLILPGQPPIIGRAAVNTTVLGNIDQGFAAIELITTEIFPMGPSSYYYRSGINHVSDRDGNLLVTFNFVTIFRKVDGEWLYTVDMLTQ